MIMHFRPFRFCWGTLADLLRQERERERKEVLRMVQMAEMPGPMPRPQAPAVAVRRLGMITYQRCGDRGEQ